MTATYKKDTTVRIVDASRLDVGEQYIVVRASTCKPRGGAPFPSYIVFPVGRDADLQIHLPREAVRAMHEIAPAQHRELDAARDAAKAKVEAGRRAWKARRAEEMVAEAMAADLDGDAWLAAEPTFTRLSVNDRGDVRAEITLNGPEQPHNETRRNGRTDDVRAAEWTYRRDALRVDVSWDQAGSRSWAGGREVHEVNWSAIGSSSPAVTRAYAGLMLYAAKWIEAITVEEAREGEDYLRRQAEAACEAGRLSREAAEAEAVARFNWSNEVEVVDARD